MRKLVRESLNERIFSRENRGYTKDNVDPEEDVWEQEYKIAKRISEIFKNMNNSDAAVSGLGHRAFGIMANKREYNFYLDKRGDVYFLGIDIEDKNERLGSIYNFNEIEENLENILV